MIDYDKLQKALKHLEKQIENDKLSVDRTELSEIDREAIKESVIQRFETAYEILWKDLKRYMIEELGLAEVPNSPKPLLKLAAQNELLSSPVQQWLDYADARTATAHDYSWEKAYKSIGIVENFLNDAILVFKHLTGKDWE